MSDKPLGPDWWMASDGTWHPPELHPSMQGMPTSPAQTPEPSSLAPATFAPAPTADVVQAAPISPMPPAAQVAPVPSAAEAAPVAQVAPIAPVAPIVPVPGRPVAPVAPIAPWPVTGCPVPSRPVAPVPEVAPIAPVAPIAELPEDAPVATVEMPGFGPTSPRPVPSLADVQSHPSWSGESDIQASAGPMFPDMFQQAVADSQLVSAVAMNFGDREHGDSLDVQLPSGSMDDSDSLETSSFRVPAEVGAFTGASAKKRRWHL